MHTWRPEGQAKWREISKVGSFCPCQPNQKTMGTPKPLQMSLIFLPPPSLIDEGPPWYHSTRFLCMEGPRGVREQVATKSKFFGTSYTHAQCHQYCCSSYSSSPKPQGWHLFGFFGSRTICWAEKIPSFMHFWMSGSQSKWQ